MPGLIGSCVERYASHPVVRSKRSVHPIPNHVQHSCLQTVRCTEVILNRAVLPAHLIQPCHYLQAKGSLVSCTSQLIACQSCRKTNPSHLSVILLRSSHFGTAVLRTCRLLVALGGLFDQGGVVDCAGLIDLGCFLLRHRTSELCDLGVVQWFDGLAAFGVFGLDKVGAGSG